MNWITARRRHPLAGYAVVLLALAVIGVVYAALSPETGRAEATVSASVKDVTEGKRLFDQSCASCHGLNAEGTKTGPSLIGVGAAAVDFQVGTGRMPAANPGAQMPRKRPVFDDQQTKALAAYVASLGGGPAIPSKEQVDPATGDAALGQSLFITNCAQCHNFAGGGGALTGGKKAPDLHETTPSHIYSAMITGPQAMPVFNDTTVTPEQKRAIIAYIVETREEPNPGGFGLDRLGPVSEGLVGWVVGLGLIVAAAVWITAKQREND
ncbi:MAG: c-type cytochrome [Streptosporangiales bacterium]|nr:c-type cytochrome [Streptosporangiales bacterium]